MKTENNIPTGWKLAPEEPTHQMIAAGALAVLPRATPKDIAIARLAAPIVLMKGHYPDETAESITAVIATMPPYYRAMLAAVPTPTGSAIGDVIAERSRQVEVEGWTHDHDDYHDAGGLASAGAAYALHAACKVYPTREGSDYERLVAHWRGLAKADDFDTPPPFWLWDTKWWKPKDPRRDLVRAAALIVAEIERLDRQTKPKEAT